MSRRGVVTVAVALGALVLLVGGAAAASRWVITSKNQIKPSVLAALKGNRGPRGLQGLPGQQGAQGQPGPQGQPGQNGPAGIATVHDVSNSTTICAFGSSCDVASVTATCPSGSFTVGGAANVNTIETPISTFAGATTYAAVANDDGSFSGTLSVTAICASGPGLQFAAKDHAASDNGASAFAERLRTQQERASALRR